MSPPERQNEQDSSRLNEAAAWRTALHDAGVETSGAFEAWLAKPGAAEAWRIVQSCWDYFGDNAAGPESMAAREKALWSARRAQQRRLAAPGRRRALAWAAAACVLICVGGVGLTVGGGEVYETGLGERRILTLDDGSRVALDSRTILKVRLGRDSRRLDLVRGQARFAVAHDPSRPFAVRAGDQLVVATGTNFAVDRIGAQILVTLFEGRVTVLKEAAPALPFLRPQGAAQVLAKLTADQQLITADSAAQGAAAPPARIELVDAERATAWESGQIIFDDEQLGSVVQRVSRYVPKPVVVEGEAADLRLSGVFNAGDVAAFVEAVQKSLPVEAAQGPDGAVVLRMRR